MCGGRLKQTGQEIGIYLDAALAVLDGVVQRGEKLRSPLESRKSQRVQPSADVWAVVPRRAGMKRAVPGSNAWAG